MSKQLVHGTDTKVLSTPTQWDALIECHGASVTLRSVTLPTPGSNGGTAAETYADSTIKVVLAQARYSTAGNIQDTILPTSFRTAYVKSDVAIKKRDIIVYGGSDWEVEDVFPYSYQGAVMYKSVSITKQI